MKKKTESKIDDLVRELEILKDLINFNCQVYIPKDGDIIYLMNKKGTSWISIYKDSPHPILHVWRAPKTSNKPV